MGRSKKLLVLSFLLLVIAAPARSEEPDGNGQCVVLLHGLFRSSLAMKPLEWHLEGEGYTVVNLSYSSTLYSIEELAETAVRESLQSCHSQGVHRIHFVTHSLGGILVRQFAANEKIEGLERVVMLGPPNQGSQVADYYSSKGWLSFFEPQAMVQLGTGDESIPRALGPVDFELGVIAGTVREETLLPGFPDEVSDGTVSLSEAMVPGMLELLQMPVTHTFMVWNPMVMSQVVHFLQYGTFDQDLQ